MEAIALSVLGIGALAGVLTLALKALSAERRAGDQKSRADALDVNLTSLASQLADVTTKHREERDRADRLDAAYAEMVQQMVARGPSGSYAFLLKIIADAKGAAGRDGARSLPPPAGANGGDDWALLRPGE